MQVSEQQYRDLVLRHPDEKWELHCGTLRRKPAMTWAHNETARNLRWLLERQLPKADFRVIVDQGRVRRSSRNYYIPDLYVVPMAMARRLFRDPRTLEAYPEPLPLVVEVWSPSTGNYDVEEKLEEYKARGDLEIWRIHPYERTLTAWRRQPDGTYTQTVFTEGTVTPIAFPNVSIPLASLFDWA